MARNRIRVIMFGLGPIGSAIARLVTQRSNMEIVGAIDSDPAKADKDLSEVIGTDTQLGIQVSAEASRVLAQSADIVVHATGSYIEAVRPQLEGIILSRHNIVSTCEELAEPWTQQPKIARSLDDLAKEHGVSVLGTGVNPGFMMDTLPLTLTAVCTSVDRIRVRRAVAAGERRQQLQAKIGTGLTPEEFRARAARKQIRHVGLAESVALVARGLGWTLDSVEETIDPVVASEVIKTRYFEVAPGAVAGTRQFGYGMRNGEAVITLELQMSVDTPQSVDEVWIEGPWNLYSRVEGVHGDLATAAVVVNAMRRVVDAPPGLITMADLPVPSCWGA